MKKAILLVVVFAVSAEGQNRLPPRMRPPACAAGLQLPDGFCATVFAEGVNGARHIVVAPIGRTDMIVTNLPMTGSHHSHNFVLQGRTLYVNIGSASNACQQGDRQAESPGYNPCTELSTRAGVWEFDANRMRQRQSDGRR